jgi:hypothetical protein
MTLLYGREVYSANGRNLNLADVPTTMLQRMDVYKTQGVDMVEGDSVGVIDARTSRPFDSKGFTANLKPRSSRCRWSCPPCNSGHEDTVADSQGDDYFALVGPQKRWGSLRPRQLWVKEQ